MAPIFSTRFLVKQGLLGTSTMITVPPGYVYIVKQLTAYGNALAGDINAFLEDGGSGAALWDGLIPAGHNGWTGFYGALVFEAGDSFYFRVTSTLGDTADVSAAGYALSP